MVNIIELFQSFQTQEQAIEHLENVRWRGSPTCAYCGSQQVSRHASSDRAVMRWQCQSCHRAFSVTVGTIFHGTHIPLKNWFLVMALMLNAKKSASAYQIARDLGMRRATVWSMMQRIRMAMAADQQRDNLLFGIVETDETYVGGKPHKDNRRDDDDTHGNKRGRGTDKPPMFEAVEPGGRVIAEVASASDILSKGLTRFVRKNVGLSGTLRITDQFPAYRRVGAMRTHVTINHAVEYVNGLLHVNTIEGFWSLIKRPWYGSHRHYSKKYMPLYIAEACYKYNNRKIVNGLDAMLGLAVSA